MIYGRFMKNIRRTVFTIALILAVGGLLSGCGGQPEAEKWEKVQKEIFAMNTIMDITLYGENAGAVMNQATERIHKYESLFSVNKPDSDISRINSAGGKAVRVSPETYELVQKCMDISDTTEGLFDISIYPLVKKWGFTTEKYRIPSEQERNDCIKQIDYKKIRLLPDNRIQTGEEMQIDLGAAAKGYLSQKLMELFQQNGITSAIVSLGGNVQTIGVKEDGNSYHIGITNPADGSSLYGTLDVKDKAVVTSGIYQRFFTKAGKSYHHIMDKRTGMPAENTLASVTVIAEDGTRADGLATALYVMGEEKAVEYQKEHPEMELILIRKDGTFWQSEKAGMKREH